VAGLARDDDQRDTSVRHLDGVGVADWVWSEAPTHTSRRGRPAQSGSGGPRSTMLGRGWGHG
jgi:hypothetical protein